MANPPTFSNVKLLCHFNGTNGATATVDSSSFARTLTRGGSMGPLTTSPVKYGSASCPFNGVTTDYWSVPDSTDWDIGASVPFTIECWVNSDVGPGVGGTYSIVSHYRGDTLSGRSWTLCTTYSSPNIFLAFNYSTDGNSVLSGPAYNWTTGIGFNLNQWYHVCIERNASNVMQLYIDGVARGSPVTDGSAFFNSAEPLQLGAYTPFGQKSFFGKVDDLRIVIGEAVYGGAFTPPTAELPAATNARVSQAVAEVLRTNTAVKAQVSQSVVEVLRTNTAVTARVSQAVVEVLRIELTVTAPPNPGHGGGNQGHPPKQDRKGLYSPTITMGTWIDQFRPNLSGLDKFFGEPGQPVPNYDWPVPKGRVPGISLRTWVNPLQITNQQPEPNRNWPVPRGYVPGIELRTWVHGLQQNLINQDSMYGPPGMVPAYDWPNPRQARFQFRGPRFSTDMTEQYSRPSGLIPPAAPVATAHGLRTNSTSYTWTGEKGEIELSYVFGNGREFDDSGIYSGIYNPEEE